MAYASLGRYFLSVGNLGLCGVPNGNSGGHDRCAGADLDAMRSLVCGLAGDRPEAG